MRTMNAMKREKGNWTCYRERFGLSQDDEIDLHFGRRDHNVSYDDAMYEVEEIVKRGLQKARENKRPYLMFIHGHSTSRPGRTTARSVVRRFMRSREATSLVVKSESIQHPTVFVARVRSAQ